MPCFPLRDLFPYEVASFLSFIKKPHFYLVFSSSICFLNWILLHETLIENYFFLLLLNGHNLTSCQEKDAERMYMCFPSQKTTNQVNEWCTELSKESTM